VTRSHAHAARATARGNPLALERTGAWHLAAGRPARARARDPQALDAALERGALTLRGYDRVLRVAWTNADLAGRERLAVVDIGRALYLKKGAHG
jgi:magnesium chelatase family protein